MRKSAYVGLGLFGLAIAANGGCSNDRCAAGDLDCFLDHMVIVEPEDKGAPMALVPVSGNKLTPTSGGTCTATLCNGACVSTSVDPHNCGGCGLACPTGASCVGGACACPPGRSECNGRCVSLGTDPTACGSCGFPCAGGEVCVNGACTGTCAPGRTLCGAACVDTRSDPDNCGGCGKACGSGESCVDGACQCTSPPYPCGCVDLTSDAQNCGGCGIACASGQVCSGGACVAPGSAGPAPSIDTAPSPITLGEPGALAPFDLEFTDPNGCAPAFCARVCKEMRCSVGFRCTRPKNDGATHGVWRSYLGFLAEPAESTETFTTGVVPVSAPGCPENLVDQIAEGTVTVSVAVGVEVEVATTVEQKTTGTGGGGGGTDGYCATVTGFCNCTVDSCANSAGECWYDTSVGTYPCGAGCNCAAAASAVVNACCPH
jgi:hypothetical protein